MKNKLNKKVLESVPQKPERVMWQVKVNANISKLADEKRTKLTKDRKKKIKRNELIEHLLSLYVEFF